MATKKRAKKIVRRGGKKKTAAKITARKKWSAKVTATSNALDLERNIFKSKDSKKIARSLKRSAERSRRKKGTPFQSAMSMLNFYINRAGKNMTKAEKKPLEKSKDELRVLFKKTDDKR